jgi:hypothetical protein
MTETEQFWLEVEHAYIEVLNHHDREIWVKRSGRRAHLSYDDLDGMVIIVVDPGDGP